MNYHPARSITLVAYFALLSVIFYSAWVFGPEGAAAKVVLWLLAVLGLLLVLPGLIKDARRSYQWLCFILLMYFIWFVQAIFSSSPDGGATASVDEWVSLALVVVLFISSMFAARWHSN